MMCARRSEGRHEELIREAEALGCTVCFEYIGRQSRTKVRCEGESEVVMVAVREKMSGDTWWCEEVEGLGRRHGLSRAGRANIKNVTSCIRGISMFSGPQHSEISCLGSTAPQIRHQR
jgi:hypothetical protein